MPNRLTVLIPCRNERENLAEVVASVREIADELLVADSGSTDGTQDLARELGCRVIAREYQTSGDFKNWAIPQAAHEWVLILDADERSSSRLNTEIREALSADPPLDGFYLSRINYFFGRPIRRGAWRPSRLLRLFRRDRGRYVGPTDHAVIVMPSERVGRLRNPMQHFAMRSYDEYLPKLYRYADVQARLWRAEGRRSSRWRMHVRGPLLFLQDYVLRGGFLDGRIGLQAAALVAFGSYLKQARLWELEQEGLDAGSASVSPDSKMAA